MRTIKHPKVYSCKRYKLYSYLRDKGFEPYSVQVEQRNPKYINWMFRNTPELEDAIDAYFAANN